MLWLERELPSEAERDGVGRSRRTKQTPRGGSRAALVTTGTRFLLNTGSVYHATSVAGICQILTWKNHFLQCFVPALRHERKASRVPRGLLHLCPLRPFVQGWQGRQCPQVPCGEGQLTMPSSKHKSPCSPFPGLRAGKYQNCANTWDVSLY